MLVSNKKGRPRKLVQHVIEVPIPQTEYEQERAERIACNRKILQELDLQNAAAQLQETHQEILNARTGACSTRTKAVTGCKRREQAAPSLPRRKSPRLQEHTAEETSKACATTSAQGRALL
eukprot:jgi/Chrzof1/3299/Cz12g20030.t1